MGRISAATANEKRRKVWDLRKQGLSYRRIAEELGLTLGSVQHYLKAEPATTPSLNVLIERAIALKRNDETLGPKKILDLLADTFAFDPACSPISLAMLRSILRSEGLSQDRSDLSHLFDDIHWPPEAMQRTFSIDQLASIKPVRAMSHDSRGKTGEFRSAKLQRSVAYESDLEQRFLKRLDRAKQVRWYTEQPFWIDYIDEDNGHPQRYVPDILVLLADGRACIVEIKHTRELVYADNHAKWRAARIWGCERGYGLLITDTYRSIQALMRHPVPADFERAMLAAVERGPIFWPVYQRILDSYPLHWLDEYAVTLKHHLVRERDPFRLYRLSSSVGD
jgi:hypothetical protein